jgi:drug/metabolite transporter (DMT)-like permease
VPIFTALIAIRVDEEERPRGLAMTGVVVGIVGVGLLFGVDLTGDSAALAGGLMVVLASLGYAVGALYLKHRLRGVPAVGTAAGTLLVSTIAVLPAAALTLPDTTPTLEATGSLLALGIGGTGLAFLLFYGLIADVGPSRASLVTYIAPAFALGYGAWLLDEPVTAGALLGLLCILAGSWFAAEGRMPVSRSGPSRSSAPAPERAR